jgi:trans-aconitate 2-methyltransferase
LVIAMWDPQQYRHFGDERSRPFFDLVARIGATEPRFVADLGCGPGDLTVTLAGRWPGAAVVGVDNSAAMVAAARSGSGQPSFVLGDVRDWVPDTPPDVIVSNAVLQWVPGQFDVLARWVSMLAGGGWVAVQVPANFEQPAHAILHELAASARWRPLLDGVVFPRQNTSPAEYLDALAAAGCAADAWETTYLHVLPGDNPVLDWVKGTALRPVLAALTPEQAAGFLAGYGERIRAAYPARPYGTVLPFRRVFAVGRRG